MGGRWEVCNGGVAAAAENITDRCSNVDYVRPEYASMQRVAATAAVAYGSGFGQSSRGIFILWDASGCSSTNASGDPESYEGKY